MKGFNSSEEFFWMILDHLEQGVALFNFNLECLFRNQLMARLWQRFTGKPEKEFADQIALKAQVPSAIRNELIKFRSLTQEQTALRRVIKLTSSSGEEFFLILKTIIYHGDQFYLVFFHEHRRRFENLHTILQEQKGLTSQEIRVVEALWRGLSIKDTNSCADPNPEAIRITIDHHHPDCEEFWDEVGNYQKRCSVYHNAPTELIVAEPFDEQDRIAGLYFPEQSLNQDLSSLTVSFPSCNSFKKGIGECRLVELENGQNVLENGAWATIAISYPDENDDGIVDGTDIKSGHLALFSPTPGSDTWTILPSISDPDQKIIMGLTQHFSEFQLGSKPRVKRPSLSCAMSQESTQAEMDISEAVILLLPMASLLWRLKKRKNN